ncbi:MAG: SpaA isopeptide-forming pilin-related protein [Enterococcus sp.]
MSVDNLAPGSYLFIETKAPNGYILNSTPIDFTISESNNGKPSVVSASENFVNYKGSAELIKHKENGKALKGAEFKVVDVDGKDIQTGLVSDKDGKVTVDNLAPGTYQFIETKAPKGYILNSTPIDFTISESNNGKPVTVVADDNFVNYKGSAELIKKDAQGNVLAGAKFKVVNAEGQTVRTGLVSDSEGNVTVKNLAPGTYQFIETKAPKGYILNSTPVEFTISESNSGKPSVVSASDNFVNYQGSAKLVKKDSAGNALAGAEFKVIDSEDELVQENLVSNKKGQVVVKDLAPGEYAFVETKAPTGYILNTTLIEFTIDDSNSGKPKVVTASDNFINYQGSAELIKKDAEGNALAGAEFKVVDTEGEVVQENLVSNDNGKVTAQNLAPGEYKFIETKAPTGYILNPTAIEFEVSAANQGEPTVVMASDNFVNYQGSAELVKKDAAGKVLADAEFKVVDTKGETVAKDLVSNKDGKVAVSGLAPGAYQFVETKSPTGYVLNTEPIDFTIADQASETPAVVVASDNFVNYQGSASLVKVDENEQPLTGAEFSVISKETQKVVQANLVSDEHGKVTAQNLAPGEYAFVETKAPTGYQLSKAEKDFTVAASAQGKPQTVEVGNFVNELLPPDVVEVTEGSHDGTHGGSHGGSYDNSQDNQTTNKAKATNSSNQEGRLLQTNSQSNPILMVMGLVLLVLAVIAAYIYRKKQQN